MAIGRPHVYPGFGKSLGIHAKQSWTYLLPIGWREGTVPFSLARSSNEKRYGPVWSISFPVVLDTQHSYGSMDAGIQNHGDNPGTMDTKFHTLMP